MFSFSRDLQQQKLKHANVQEICRSLQNRWVGDLVMSSAWHEELECNCSRDLQQQKLQLPDFGFAHLAMHALDIRNLNMIVQEYAAAEACIVQFVMSLARRT
jgi:hypothetical protein